MSTPTLPPTGSQTRRLLALPQVTLQTVHYPGLDATIIKRNTFREMHVTVRPLPGERPMLWSWRLDSFLRHHGAILVKQDVFGTLAGCEQAVRLCGRLLGQHTWPITCVGGASCPGNAGLTGMQVLAVGGESPKTIVVNGRPVGRVFNDGWARHCVLGDLRPRALDATRTSQAAQVYQEMEDVLARAGFVLSNLVRTWLFINNILDWYKEFNEVRTEIFTQNGLFAHCVPASTGIGAANPFGAALIAGAWAMQPLDGSGLTITEVASPLQCSARKYGSCFSRAVAITGAGLERLFISGTASIAPDGGSVHRGNVRAQIELTMDVVKEILRSRDMRWSNVSRAIVYMKNATDAACFNEWCALHDVRLPVLLVQADVCRDELLFEIELDAMAIQEEES